MLRLPTVLLASLRWPRLGDTAPRRRRWDLPGSWGTLPCAPCSSTPVGPPLPRPMAAATMVPGRLLRKRRLPRLTAFEARSHGPHVRCLRFATGVAPAPRKTRYRLGGLALGRTGLQPAGFHRRVSARLYVIASSLPRLSWRTAGAVKTAAAAHAAAAPEPSAARRRAALTATRTAIPSPRARATLRCEADATPRSPQLQRRGDGRPAPRRCRRHSALFFAPASAASSATARATRAARRRRFRKNPRHAGRVDRCEPRGWREPTDAARSVDAAKPSGLGAGLASGGREPTCPPCCNDHQRPLEHQGPAALVEVTGARRPLLRPVAERAAELCGTTRQPPLRGRTDGGRQAHGRS